MSPGIRLGRTGWIVIPLCLKDSSGERDIVPPLPAGSYTAQYFHGSKWRGPHVTPAELVVLTK